MRSHRSSSPHSILARLRHRSQRQKWVAPCLMAVWICCGWVTIGLGQQLNLNIYHIDVGQGDATLIISPTGRTVLIDGGNRGKGDSAVVPLLRSLGITKIDYVVASHYDADHIGGLDEVVRGIRRIGQTAYDRGEVNLANRTREYREYVAAIGRKRRTIAIGTKLDLGPQVELECVAVNGNVKDRARPPMPEPVGENDQSIAFRLRYGRFDYFTGGDLTGGGRSGLKTTSDVETVVAGVVGDVDVLRINHHGSNTSSNKQFLEALKPETAIISVGTGGVNVRYRHPTRQVLNRLHRVPGLEKVFQTSRGNTAGGLRQRDLERIEITNQTIHLSTDGARYLINGRAFPVDEE